MANQSDERFLRGGGEMGERIRAFDWANTAIGPVSKWSPALRSTVGLLLQNRFPLILWWGHQFIQFYNDTYIPIPGEKHPKALGQPASECWAEIWHVIGPMIEAPFSGQPAAVSDDLFLLMNRKGFIEETHFKVAYSPVPDDTIQPTGVGGVLATVAETTEQVYGERQLRTLRELGTRAIEAKTPEQACQSAAATLTENSFDVPFALFYLVEPGGKQGRLVASCGFNKTGSANPAQVDIGAESPWPLSSIVHKGETRVITGLAQKFDFLPAGRWSQPPQSAIVLPLTSPDQPHAYGILIAGLNPHREFNVGYRTFFELAAAQVTTAIRNANAYQEEKKRAESLAEIDRAKTTFFSNVSHEFRTPLTLMLSPLEDLLSKANGNLPAEEKAQLSMIHSNGLRLLKLVNNLLDFSRIEAGRVQAVYQPVDLADYTAELASIFRSAIEKVGLQLKVDCPPLPQPVYIDKEMWEKIVLNLLSNAFKFTFAGEIAVSLHWCGDHVELAVKDTGIGIAPEEMPRLFERFHRIQGVKARTHEGTGIGLALVQELVKLHGGAVKASSTLDKGTAFTVIIPAGSAHLPKDRIGAVRTLASTSLGANSFVEEALKWLPEEEKDFSLSNRQAGSVIPETVINTPGSNEGKVLVVDDNADMRHYIRSLLSRYYKVEVAANGQAALEAIRNNPPDLVLTDIMMPVMDGFELLHALRTNPETKTLPIILLSARAGEESRVEGMEKGADDYLIKPFSANELVARVRTHLELELMRKQSQEAVRKSERNLTEAELLGRIGNWEWDLQTGVVKWSKGIFAIYRLNPDTFVPSITSFGDYVHPDDREYVNKMIDRIMSGNKSVNFDFRIVLADNSIRFINTIGEITTYDEKGKPCLMVGINQDITERKQAEEAVKNNEKLLQSLFDSPGIMRGMVEIVDDTTVRHIADNAVTASFVGLPPEALRNKLSSELGEPPEIIRTWVSHYRQSLKIGKPVTFEYEDERGDKKAWLSATVSCLRTTPSGDPQFTYVVLDITERKKAELALMESEERFRALANNIPQLAWMADGTGWIFWYNQRWYDYTGTNLEEMKGWGWQKVHHPDYVQPVTEKFKQHIATGEAWEDTFPLRGKDGNYRWFLSRAFPIRDAQGKITRWFGTNTDITETREAADNLKRYTSELESVNKELESYSYSISHDIRTPLRTLDGFSEAVLLEYGEKLDETGKDYLNRIRKASQTMSQLTIDILKLSRITRTEMHHDEANLSEIAKSVIEELRATQPERQAEFIIAPGLVVNGDKSLLQMLLRNLLENSWKYTGKCPNARIEFGVVNQSEEQVYFIKDNGVGFDMKYYDKLFQPFQRLHANKDYPGTGIGLATAQRVIRRHGGDIWAESEIEKGTTFYFTLGKKSGLGE